MVYVFVIGLVIFMGTLLTFRFLYFTFDVILRKVGFAIKAGIFITLFLPLIPVTIIFTEGLLSPTSIISIVCVASGVSLLTMDIKLFHR